MDTALLVWKLLHREFTAQGDVISIHLHQWTLSLAVCCKLSEEVVLNLYTKCLS